LLPVSRRNLVTGRFELADKDELDIDHGATFRIGAYTVGYTRDIGILHNVDVAIGANFSVYSLPDALKPHYGSRPVGGNFFVRFRLKPPA
jgi:hypothetical protein